MALLSRRNRITDVTVSARTSLSTITSSEMDRAILETVENVDGFLPKCKDPFKGDSITKSGKRKQICRMVGVVLIPIAVLCGMTANSMGVSLQRYMDLFDIRQYLFYGLEIGNLLHRLQAERDKSCLYASDFGPENKKFLLEVYPLTDSAIENMTFWTVANNQRPQFRTREAFLRYLNQHRYSLDLENSVNDEIEFYSDIIDVFISWLYEAVSESRTGVVWKSLVAYQEMIIAKEASGKERSFGILFYARGGFRKSSDLLDFSEAQDSANVTLKSATLYSPNASAYFDSLMDNNSITKETIRKLRKEIKDGYISPNLTLTEQIEFWYNNMTVYLDTMLQTQRYLSRRIDELLNEAAYTELLRLLSISFVVLAVVIVSPITACAVYRLTKDIQKCSTSLVERNRDLIKEKRLTDSLIYQMLPKSVSKQLKESSSVKTEMYEECTICFSDIHGFTRLCSLSTPRQVVELLSLLNSQVDAVLDLHDVYKVETIGDAYMIASGIPKRNGKKHAQEIVSMALDILDVVKDIDIPHFRGNHIKMRLGCHTGPVVTGVVGVKMPRYSLYGDTVQIANRMEALGKAGMVHISQTTHDILAEIDDSCQMVPRDDPAVKNDKELMDIFKGSVRTYWLVSDGRVQSRQSESSSDAMDGWMDC